MIDVRGNANNFEQTNNLLTISCYQRPKYSFLTCAVVATLFLSLQVTVTSSVISTLLRIQNATEINLGILVAETCDSKYREDIERQIERALEDFKTFIKLTEEDLNPRSVQIKHTTFPFCDTRDVVSNLDVIFGNDTIQVILSISTYDIHSSLIPLAEIYNKGYILVNAYIFTLAQTPSISFSPKFSQNGLILAKVLDMYKWEEVSIIYSNFNYWMNFATYMYYAMTSYNFKVDTRLITPSPVTSENAITALKDSSQSKAILLLMDVSDQLSVLAAASSLSMTTGHAYFSFTKTPYDINTQSIIGVKPAVLKQPQFISDSQARNVNIMESVFVLAFSFPAPISRDNSTAKTRLRKRDINTHQSVPLFTSLKARFKARNKSSRYDTKNVRYFQLGDSVNKTNDNFSSDTTDADTVYKTYTPQGAVTFINATNEARFGNVNITTTDSPPDSQIISKTNLVPIKSSENSSLFAQAQKKTGRTNDTFRHNQTSGDFSQESEKTNFDLLNSMATGDMKSENKLNKRLIYETENPVWLQQSRENVQSWEQGYSNVRSKRDIEMFVPSDADIYAVYDIVFLLTLATHLQSKRGNMSLESDNLITSIANLSFPGYSGTFQLDQKQQVSFDFSLYDFDVDSGLMKQRIYFQATSSESWTLRKENEVDWPGEVELSPDECFKQLPGCNSGLKSSIIAGIVVAVLAVIVLVIIAAVAFRRHWVNREMTRGPNKVILCQEDLVFVLRKEMAKGSRMMKSRVTLLDKDSAPDLIRGSEPNRSLASINELTDHTQTARYNGDLVYIKELNIKGFEMRNKLLTFVRMCRDLRHENLNPYVGFLADLNHPSIVIEYCSRGSLYDVIHNDDFKLDWDFKLSLLTDLVRGVRYLHSSALKCHGHLTSKSCVIDSRFVLKITDYGVPGIMEYCKAARLFTVKDLLWSAPEMLRDESYLQRGSDKGDIYAMSIIFQEVALRTEPYSTTGLTPEEIVRKLKKPPPLIRPSVTPQAGPPLFIQIMKQCWSESPEMRPGIDEIYDQFKTLTGGKKANIVDTMFKMLEKYSTDLEDIVAERTMQLEEEKKKTDQLLFRMLPPTVAENLKIGKSVEAECFDEVTIYFSDIVGFTTISAMSTPMQVVDLLNDLYSMFDATINNHDVYKVETIGDAYMVVSGLPVRNGNRHAGEIGTLALVLLSQCGQFTIRHMPQVPLRIRIGLHTGSCVAGVVGLTMPRFCLFGDTVNTASRMESSGAAFRIHISEACKVALDELGGYKSEYRGQTELKGKGMHNTYWLIGKEGFVQNLPEPPPLIGNKTHGLDSILGDLKIDLISRLDVPQNDIISKSSSAPNLATPAVTPNLNTNPLPSSNDVNAASSHPDSLHELYKHVRKKSKATKSSAVKADINIIGSGVNASVTQSSKKNIDMSTVPSNGTCQSSHSESNDSGFGSERKHSEGNEWCSNNWTKYSDDSEQFQRSTLQSKNRSNQQNNSRTFITSSLNVVSRKSYLPIDVEDLTTVTEV